MELLESRVVRPRQARWPKSCIASLAEIFASADGNPGIFNSERRGPNFGAQLVHNNLQMRSFYATESTLNHSKQMKRGVREQGRKISKPPLTALPLSERAARITGMNPYSYSETVW
jgi:hypothetical protein